MTLPKEVPKENFDQMNNFDYDSEDQVASDEITPATEAVEAAGKHINQQSVADVLIKSNNMLVHGGSQQMAKVIKKSSESEGNVIGDLYGNLNSLVYNLAFPGRAINQYATNVIAENVLSQVAESGFHSQTLSVISQHEVPPNAIKMQDG